MQLMWACGTAACALRVASKYSLLISEEWTAELAAGLWFVVPATGFEPARVDPTNFETLCLTTSPHRQGQGIEEMLQLSGN